MYICVYAQLLLLIPLFDQVSYAELYNENIYDLLNPTKDPTEISLSEDSKGCVHLLALIGHPIFRCELIYYHLASATPFCDSESPMPMRCLKQISSIENLPVTN